LCQTARDNGKVSKEPIDFSLIQCKVNQDMLGSVKTLLRTEYGTLLRNEYSLYKDPSLGDSISGVSYPCERHATKEYDQIFHKGGRKLKSSGRIMSNSGRLTEHNAPIKQGKRRDRGKPGTFVMIHSKNVSV
jgi:hypothetical protein